MNESAELYTALRKVWPNLPEPAMVRSYRIQCEWGRPPLLEIEVAQIADSDLLIGFREYELVRRS